MEKIKWLIIKPRLYTTYSQSRYTRRRLKFLLTYFLVDNILQVYNIIHRLKHDSGAYIYKMHIYHLIMFPCVIDV